MITVTLLGSFAFGVIVGMFIATYIDEIIDWAKNAMMKIAAGVKKAQIWIKRIPSGIKQFLYYIKNGEYMVKERERPATPEEIKKIKDKMNSREQNEFEDDGFHAGDVDRDA